jgi:hypothetical protein
MMVKIIVSEDGGVDFATPIYVSEQKANKIIDFLRALVGDIEVQHVEEPHISYDRGPSSSKRWTREEYLELLKASSSEELEEKLGRSDMSIGMRRGDFLPLYLEWLRRKGLLERREDHGVQEKFVDEVLSE